MGSLVSIRSTDAASASAATASAAAATTAGEGRGGLEATEPPDGADRDDETEPLDPAVPDGALATDEAPAGGATMARNKPFVTCEVKPHKVRHRQGVGSTRDKRNPKQMTTQPRQAREAHPNQSLNKKTKQKGTQGGATETPSLQGPTAKTRSPPPPEGDDRTRLAPAPNPTTTPARRAPQWEQVHCAPATPLRHKRGLTPAATADKHHQSGTDWEDQRATAQGGGPVTTARSRRQGEGAAGGGGAGKDGYGAWRREPGQGAGHNVPRLGRTPHRRHLRPSQR